MYLSTRANKDRAFNFILKVSGLFSSLSILLVFLFLIKESLPLLGFETLSFFSDSSWFPLEGKFNIVPMIIGSLSVTFGAVLLGLPLGIFSAIFIKFYSTKKISWISKRIVELYAAVPSVIFGFWGLVNIVPYINEINPPGQSLLAGIIILGLMIYPIISLSLISAIETSSKQNRVVSESLGLRKSTYIWKVLFPSIKGEILSGTLLATARAVGETMAVLMVCGNIVKVPSSIFDPIRALTANIALEMSYATDEHRSALFISGLILLMIVTLLFILSDQVKRIKVWK